MSARRLLVAVSVTLTVLAMATTFVTAPASASVADGLTVPARTPLLDSLRGRSRKLLARFVSPSRAATIPILRQLFGDSALHRAGVYSAAVASPDDSAKADKFHFITMRPFADKISGRIGAYRIGRYAGERTNARAPRIASPEGFLEVTSGNQDTPVSENFRLRDFITHDQGTVWPKYLVLREPLVDKLELVLSELRAMGLPVDRLKVMSGFRTPQYNAQGVGAGGRAKDSRHQYGDAADVYAVSGNRDFMSDLDRNGRVDTRDARLLAIAAERVEREYPELVGGVAVYPATRAHGPFVHIDVRGTRARWGVQ